MNRKKTNATQSYLPFASNFILYQTDDGQTRIEVRLQDESMWMTQAMIEELYQTTSQNITLHIKAIYREGEQQEEATCKECLQVQTEGNRTISRARKFGRCLPETPILAIARTGLFRPTSASRDIKDMQHLPLN